MPENKFSTPVGILEVLLRDGYNAAADLIETLQSSISRTAELAYMKQFAADEYGYLDTDLGRDQFRALWTAYCLHHDLRVDTGSYDADSIELWDTVSTVAEKTDAWHDFDTFDLFMGLDLS